VSKEVAKPEGIVRAGGVLDRIVEAKLLRVAEAKRNRPLESLGPKPAARSFAEAVGRRGRANVIAEIKHRSPSRGVIRESFDAVRIAESYAGAGAAALSVLTEEDFFGGSLDHLRRVRSATALPILRKDFVFDEYQVYESAAAGADAILLIVAILNDELLARLLGLAGEMGLDALVEVHTLEEMERASRAGARIIGVNNRDLTSFKVELETSTRLARFAPEGAILVSESGINSGADIRRLSESGFNAFLVGEHFMRADDPGEALRQLIADADGE
jgi:indole-3-glycerol phosphate synthase